MFVLFNMIFSSIAALINPNVSALYALLVFIPALAVTVRRLHDVGKSGWMMLIVFIPFIGAIWLLVLLLQRGDLYQDFSTSNDNFSTKENTQTESSESKKYCCSDNVSTDDVDPQPTKEEAKSTEEVKEEIVKETADNDDVDTTDINADDFKRS